MQSLLGTIFALLIAANWVTATWIDWQYTNRDWQIGFLNITVGNLGEYRSTLTGIGTLEFEVKRRDSPEITLCEWFDWSSPTPPSGWKLCASPGSDLWFHFNMYAWTDLELQLEIMEVKSYPNFTFNMRDASLDLSTKSFDVANRLSCDADWDVKRHLECSMNGPIFPSTVQSIQPNTRSISGKPLTIASTGTISSPSCTVEVDLQDPNMLAFVANTTDATETCKTSWDCLSSAPARSKNLNCTMQNDSATWAANVTLALAPGSIPNIEIAATHSFHITQRIVDQYARDPNAFNGAQWIDAIVESETVLRLDGAVGGSDANKTVIRFEARN